MNYTFWINIFFQEHVIMKFFHSFWKTFFENCKDFKMLNNRLISAA